MAAPGLPSVEEEIHEVKKRIKKKEDEEEELEEKLKQLEEGSSEYIRAEKNLDHTRKILEGAQKILAELYEERKLLRSQAGAGQGTSSAAGAAAVQGGPQTHLNAGLEVSSAYPCVDRLVHESETIGTCVLLGDGVVLAARHCVVEKGKCLKGLFAFGSELVFVGALPDLDVVVFKCAKVSGPCFQLAASVEQGAHVYLLSFPQAYDVELKLEGATTPAIDEGIVSQVSETGQAAAATFSTGMPNSSGGGVICGSHTLAGLYLGRAWHLELFEGSSGNSNSSGGGGGRAVGGGSDGGGSSSSSSSRGRGPPSAIERDPDNMWDDEEVSPVEAAAADDRVAAHLSRVNIPHKTSSALFVPAPALRQLLQALGLADRVPLDAAMGEVAGSKRRRRGAGAGTELLAAAAAAGGRS